MHEDGNGANVKWICPVGLLVLLAGACGGAGEGSGASSGAPPSPDGGDGASCPALFTDCDGNPATICETRLDSDKANCGACGKACPGTGVHQSASCIAGACGVTCDDGFIDCDKNPANGCESAVGSCGVTTLVATLSAAMGLSVDNEFVYYGTKGTPPDYPDGILYKIPKSGGTPTVLATALNRPLNIALDDARVYWTNGGHPDVADGSVMSVAKTGGVATTIAGPMTRPGNPVIAGDRIYWTVREQPLGRIVSARKDGTDAAPVDVVTGINNATDLQRAGDTLVWATSGLEPMKTDPIVERAGLDGMGRITLAKGIGGPSFQLGISADAVFVGSGTDGTVRRLPFDLSAPSIVAAALADPQEVLVDGAMIYVTTGNGRRVVGVPMAGGTPVIIADGQVNPSYLAVDADNLYWTDGSLSGAATIRKAKKPGK